MEPFPCPCMFQYQGFRLESPRKSRVSGTLLRRITAGGAVVPASRTTVLPASREPGAPLAVAGTPLPLATGEMLEIEVTFEVTIAGRNTGVTRPRIPQKK